MLISPNGVFHDTPTPVATRGVESSVTKVTVPLESVSLVTCDKDPISTKARPVSPRSAEIGSGKRSSVDCV